MRLIRSLLIKVVVISAVMGVVNSFMSPALASSIAGYPCSDAERVCTGAGGTRIIDGFPVKRDCWEWSYVKTCAFPGKNDCQDYAHCYVVRDLPCKLKDSQGTCLIKQREFSCKAWNPVTRENKTVRVGLEEKDGQEGLVCEGIPCIDGNCVDKSYMTNGEMMDSLSKLYATSKMNPDGKGNINLFPGSGRNCTKDPLSYRNCCSTDPKGWGQNIGAHCSSDEKQLMEARSRNLCVYVGKEKTGVMKSTVKHHFCCFNNLIDKVIQTGARAQLGMSFGSGGNPECRGLTLEEIQRINFDKVDFTEFIEDFKLKFAGKYKAPNVGDLTATVQGSLKSMRRYDNNPDNRNNNLTGWKDNIKDDSWEADEERRIEAERLAELEKQRLAKLEAERLEKEKAMPTAAQQRQNEVRIAWQDYGNARGYFVRSKNHEQLNAEFEKLKRTRQKLEQLLSEEKRQILRKKDEVEYRYREAWVRYKSKFEGVNYYNPLAESERAKLGIESIARELSALSDEYEKRIVEEEVYGRKK